MMVILDYISAKRRLKAVEKDIRLYGKDMPDQILMQRDFIEKEVEYYGEECGKYLVVAGCLLIGFMLYWSYPGR
jgi:hypothetical protein